MDEGRKEGRKEAMKEEEEEEEDLPRITDHTGHSLRSIQIASTVSYLIPESEK